MSQPWPPAGTVPLSIDVVSVQSQVAYGRVGNNVALPTLARRGLQAAAVPTVVFGNTPHYPTMHGGAMPATWFAGWLDDLVARGALDALRGVLCGYLGSAAQASVLARWIRQRCRARPDLRIVIDPVIGDREQGVYVDPRLVDAYRGDLRSLADGLTPNAFELAQLAGRETGDVADTVAAARTLLTGRTRWVAATSAAPQAWSAGTMQVVVATHDRAWLLTHPRVGAEPKGTGDLFAAHLMAALLRGDALPLAVACACQQVVEALRVTHAARCAELLLPPPDAPLRHGHPDVRVSEIAAGPMR